MKFAMRHPCTLRLLETYDSKPWIVAGYFFHDRGTTIQKSVRGFLGELLYQILDQRKDLFYIVLPIFSQLLDLQPSKLGQSDIWDREKLEEVLVLFGTMAKADINLCVFVNALDEHDSNHKSLFSTLSKLQNLTPSKYAQGRLSAELRSGVSYKGKAELNGLIADVIMRAQGVFLWVRLVVDEMIEGLCEGDTIHELRSLLSTIPRFEKQHVVMGSGEEDSVIFIRHENIASSNKAGGLDERSPVQFIHQPVKEFMQTGEGYAVIREGLAEDLQESGTVLMFRYILGLISNFVSEDADLDASRFVVDNFVRYAQSYEQGEHQRASN
ncbi:hypothetical protein NA56DRAFT_695039 [Hyaloscypha hepaticicola]|uniref:Nephrocystin 3-like N-terminal domain-containing protein n=1 Tax=Hyaloscypha hepaticicola TaxID=2082293 RepID=A0A2J6PGD0_9HELO|nr:hypothetical protein NA56DRAFT_695039 [Hyaloscypha hepaticicola]